MSFDVPPPHPELKRLEPLIGSRRAEKETEPSVLGPCVTVTSKESFEWLDGGYFLVSTYETKFGDEPPPRKASTTGATTPTRSATGSSSSATTAPSDHHDQVHGDRRMKRGRM